MSRFSKVLISLWSKPHTFLLAFIAPIAIGLVFIVPPFQSPDEHTHFFKAVQLATGKLVGSHMGESSGFAFPLVGDFLPEKYKSTADHYIKLRLDINEKADVGQVFRHLGTPSGGEKLIPTPFENTVVYPPLAYVPQAAAVFIARLFNDSPLVHLYAARLAGLTVAFALFCLAVMRIPRGKWAIVALAATPMSLLLAGSVSGDAITAGLAIFFIATVASFAYRPGLLTRNEMVQLVLLSAALGLCKAPYLLLTLLVLAMPMSRFDSKRMYALIASACVAISIFMAVIWNFVVRHLYINLAAGSSTGEQLQYMLAHPFNFVLTLAKTYLGSAGDYVPRTFIDLSAGLFAPLPIWFICVSFLVIILVVIAEKYPPQLKISKKMRWISAAVLITGFVAINALLYLTFTPVGSRTIDGLQGRYFIPFAFLLIPALGGLLPTDSKRYAGLVLFLRCFILFTGMVTLYVLVKRYYY